MSFKLFGPLLGAAGLAAAAFCPAPAFAHAIAGDRVFPATLAIDDPGVSDELALPTLTYLPINSDMASEFDVEFDYAKRITDNLALSIGDGWSRLKPGGAGWDNLDLGAKYQFYVDAPHEFMASVGVDAEVGGTGASKLNDPFSTITPNVYFGKGFGDLPAGLNWLRPFAVTGQFGLSIPSESRTGTDPNPTTFDWGGTLQYSLPYINSNIREIGGPEFLKHLVPLVEVAFQTPVGDIPRGGAETTGTVQPGIVYMADTYQVALEAVIPVNSASGRSVGVIGELHFFLDDIFPKSIGKPLFQ